MYGYSMTTAARARPLRASARRFAPMASTLTSLARARLAPERTNVSPRVGGGAPRCAAARAAGPFDGEAPRYDATRLDTNGDFMRALDAARVREIAADARGSVIVCFTQRGHVRTVGATRGDGARAGEHVEDGASRAPAFVDTTTFARACANAGVDFDIARDATYIGRDLTRDGRAVFAIRAANAEMDAVFVAALDAPDADSRAVKAATAKALGMADAALIANASSLVNWRSKVKFCRECGSGVTWTRGGRVAKCVECGARTRPDLTPACLSLITCGNYVLLGRNAKWPQGFYSLLAGFVEPSETLERCVAREAFEEASIELTPSSIEYVASQPWPFPNQIMLGFRAAVEPVKLGPLKMPPAPKLRDDELSDARWFHVDYLASRLAPERAFADPRDGAMEEIPFGEIALPGEHALARRLVQGWLDEKLSSRRRRCDDRLVTTVVEGSFFTECELSSGDDSEEIGGGSANFVEDEQTGEYHSLNFVMVEVLLAQEGQAPVVIRAAPVDTAVIHKQVVAEVERVGEGARAIAYVRATGKIKCKKESSGAQSIYIKMFSEASDDGFDARAITIAMLQKACPFHEFHFSQ